MMELNHDSWVLKVAKYGGLYCVDRTDICSLLRRFLWGLVRAPFWALVAGAVIAVVLAFVVGWPLIGLVAYIAEGLPFEWESFVGLSILGLGIGFGFAVYQTEEAGGIKTVLRKATPELIRSAYRGWKEKTCVLVEVRGEPGQADGR